MWKSYDSQYFQVVDYENLQFGLLLAKKNSKKIYEYHVFQAEKAQKHTFNFLQTKTAQKSGI